MMRVINATEQDQIKWNVFVKENYPPIGAFMLTWEWGDFLKACGKKVERYFVIKDEALIAAFTMVEYPLPLGFRYAYAPRGPVVARSLASGDQFEELFIFLRAWVVKEFPDLLFVRFEPPLDKLPDGLASSDFQVPDYYIQPKYNHAVDLKRTEAEILMAIHPSTRSNLLRAEKRGVTVKIEEHRVEDEYELFSSVALDTVQRNSGRNLYPARSYFISLFKTLSPFQVAKHDPAKLKLVTLHGYQNGNLVAIHYALFFGDTVTYLYGASRTAGLSSKVTTYLHWKGLLLAREQGMAYYDLGGVDEKLWPSLTDFKRQFRGTEFTYIGNLDMPLNRLLYLIYDWLQKLRKKIR